MTLHDIIHPLKPKMQDVITHFEGELKSVRTGRAHGGLVENITVSYYGTETPIKQMAGITVPEATQLLITPWDRQALGDIEQAIRQANLGINPTNDGQAIRIILPALNEERRRDLVKQIGTMAETARISLRNLRKDAWEQVQKAEKSGDLPEDDRYRGEEELNKLIDDFNKQVEEKVKAKEQELMSL